MPSQLGVTLYDDGRSERTSTATLTATITRNENAPKFNDSDYKVRINDRYDLGREIIVVGATDSDMVSKTYDTGTRKSLHLTAWIKLGRKSWLAVTN